MGLEAALVALRRRARLVPAVLALPAARCQWEDVVDFKVPSAGAGVTWVREAFRPTRTSPLGIPAQRGWTVTEGLYLLDWFTWERDEPRHGRAVVEALAWRFRTGFPNGTLATDLVDVSVTIGVSGGGAPTPAGLLHDPPWHQHSLTVPWTCAAPADLAPAGV